MTDPDVAAVIVELDAHRERFIAFCRSLSADQLDRPVPKSSWLVRDFIAHLATIDRPVGQMFQAMHEGGSGFRPEDGRPWNVDEWNERQIQERRGWPLERVLEEAAEVRAGLRAQLDALTAEDVQRTLHFGGDGKRPPSEVRLLDYLRGWNKHDPMHAFDMTRGVPEAVTPAIEAWFDTPAVRRYQAIMNPDG